MCHARSGHHQSGGADQAVRRHRRPGRRRPRRPVRFDPGRSRPERSRQDHRRPHPDHADRAGRRPAWVAGHDVVRDPAAVQRSIGRDRPGRHGRRPAHRAAEPGHDRTPERPPAGRRPAPGRPSCWSSSTSPTPPTGFPTGYSGGMRRRLDLAAGLVTRPPVLFLDEPTTGLDPTSRVRMWDVIRDLVTGGVTLLLTTQYLDEADELADRIVVIDHGRVIADGTSGELKADTGGARLEVTLSVPADGAADALVALRLRPGPRQPRRPTPPRPGAQRVGSGHHRGARPRPGRHRRRRRRGAPAVPRRRLLRPHRPSDRSPTTGRTPNGTLDGPVGVRGA